MSKYACCMCIVAGFLASATVAASPASGQAAGTSTAGADEFHWLEPPHDPKALAWAKQQTEEATQKLQALPLYAAIQGEMKEVLKAKTESPDVTLLGKRAIRLLRTASHPHGLLQVATRDSHGVPGAWQTALDVDALRKREGVPYTLQAFSLRDTCLGPEFNRCLLRLSPGGGDEVEIREFDLDQGRFVAGGFKVPRSHAFAQWMDADDVLVEATVGGAPTTASGWPAQVQLWHRGTPLKSARVVYTAKPTDAIVEINAFGEGRDRYGVITRAINYSTFETLLVASDGHVKKTPLPTALKMSALAATRDHLIVQLAANADVQGTHYKAETVLGYSVGVGDADGRVSAVYVPPPDNYITNSGDIAATNDEVLVITSRHLVQQLNAVKWDGHAWQTREVMKAAPGETLALQPGAGGDNDVVVSTSGFVTPKRQELYVPGQPMRVLATDPTLFDGTKYVTEIGSATSRDGTRVDYYLLKPRTPVWKGAQPTLLTGYAAFGISFRPEYFNYEVGGRSFVLWLERGGSLVLPAARGGGERGDAWHRAAMRQKRQNSYDDFFAVVKKLMDQGYTTPSRLGVFGSSNGGLLAAVLGTERPDLFNAVVSDVPLTDMFRMKYMGMGAAWLDEYGDPDDPEYARALRKYSPYQNVRSGVHYPPFMITSSTEDNRVGPGHARKFAAKLESVGATVYFLEEQEGGHGVSDAFDNPELMSLRMTFLIHQLMSKGGTTGQASSGGG